MLVALGRIAQLVEQGIENPCVGGSTPSPATPSSRCFAALFVALLCAAGCGDSCERLCLQATDRVAECRPAALTWADLGATGRADFTNRCRQQWDRVYADLEAHDQDVALQLCEDGLDAADALTCDEILALYGLRE
jgi:hypothetical protein